MDLNKPKFLFLIQDYVTNDSKSGILKIRFNLSFNELQKALEELLSEKEGLGGSGRGLELLKYMLCELDDLSLVPRTKEVCCDPSAGEAETG